MVDTPDKNFISTYDETPVSELPLADLKNNQQPLISDLTTPLPSVPDVFILPSEDSTMVVPHPVIVATESINESEDEYVLTDDNNEYVSMDNNDEYVSVDNPDEYVSMDNHDEYVSMDNHDEYVSMDNNDSMAPLISPGFEDSPSPFASPPPPPPPPPLLAPAPPSHDSPQVTVDYSYTPEPYETPLNLISEPIVLPTSPPLLPPPSPPLLPPPSPPLPSPSPLLPPPSPFLPPPPSHQESSRNSSQLRVSSSSVGDTDDNNGSSLAYQDINSSTEGHENGLVYEELNDTNNDSNPSMYVDVEQSSVYADVEAVDDPTYDDIPGQIILQEPQVHIWPGGQVGVTMVQSQGQPSSVTQNQRSSIPTVENEQDFQGLFEDAPPSYNALFGAPSEIPTVPMPVPQAPQQTAAAVRNPPLIVRPTVAPVTTSPNIRSPSENRNDSNSNWCLRSANKSPLKTGIYLFIFLLGIFVPLGTLGLGIGLFLTTPSDENTTSIYLIVIGSFASFFVCWHTTALIVGAYIKAHNVPQRHSMSSCCMRLFHCGAFFWWGAVGYLSYLIWPNVVNGTTSLDILTIVMLGFLTFQYLMTLYCCIEALVDCRGCIKDRISPTDNDF